MLIGGFSGVWVTQVSFMDGSCKSVSSVWNLRRVMRRDVHAQAARARVLRPKRSEVSDSLKSLQFFLSAVLYNIFRFWWVAEWSRSNPAHFDDTTEKDIGSNHLTDGHATTTQTRQVSQEPALGTRTHRTSSE